MTESLPPTIHQNNQMIEDDYSHLKNARIRQRLEEIRNTPYSQQRSSPMMGQLPRQSLSPAISIESSGSSPTNITDTIFSKEPPTLAKIHKLFRKEVIKKPLVHEQVIQEHIEVHERPIEKRIVHPLQEYTHQSEIQYEETGKDESQLARDQYLEDMRQQDRNREIEVVQSEDKDVKVIEETPQIQTERQISKRIVEVPKVTEIHYQPVREYYEQRIVRVVHQKPIITVVRQDPIMLESQPYAAAPPSSQQQFQEQISFISEINQEKSSLDGEQETLSSVPSNRKDNLDESEEYASAMSGQARPHASSLATEDVSPLDVKDDQKIIMDSTI